MKIIFFAVGKFLYGSTFFLQTMAVVNQMTINNESFYETVSKNVPAKVIYVISIVYAICFISYKIILFGMDIKKKYQLDQIIVKRAAEDLLQEKIDTAVKNKKLENE